MDPEKLYDLLGTRDIPGKPDEITILCRRIKELLEMNGEAWIRDNRRKLLSEWEYALRYLISASN